MAGEEKQQSSTALNAGLIALAALVIAGSIFFAFRHKVAPAMNAPSAGTNTPAAAQNANTGKFEGDSITVGCSSNDDCVVWGCSSQLCGRKVKVQDLTTTCEYKDVYSCTKLTTCGCFEGECQWQQTPDYTSCVEKKKSS